MPEHASPGSAPVQPGVDASASARPSVVRTRIIPGIALAFVIGLLSILAYALFAPDDGRVANGRISASGAIVYDDPRVAPDFMLHTFAGEPFHLSEQRGKIVILNFWASWCLPCRDETPLLETAAGRLGDDTIVVGVNVQDTEKDARAFLAEFDVSYPNMRDDGGKVSIDYGLAGVPETFVVNADGRIVAKLVGPVTSVDQLRAIVAEAR